MTVTASEHTDSRTTTVMSLAGLPAEQLRELWLMGVERFKARKGDPVALKQSIADIEAAGKLSKTMPRNAAGLNALQVWAQSNQIHPDWDSKMHRWYLVEEEFFDAEYVAGLPVEEWCKETVAPAPAPQPFQPTKNTRLIGGNIDEAAARVPEGRYAVETPAGVKFYQVDKPAQGKWEGFTFVNQLVGAPGDFTRYPVKKLPVKLELLKKLGESPEEAARLFGQKTEHCGACMSPLSQPQSRAAGYGEKCASNHGFWYPTEAEALEILGESK